MYDQTLLNLEGYFPLLLWSSMWISGCTQVGIFNLHESQLIDILGVTQQSLWIVFICQSSTKKNE